MWWGRYKDIEVEDIMNESDIFDSELHIADKVIIRVPIKILSVCRAIQKKVNEHEFSILVKAAWNKNVLELSENFVIPKQEVTYSSVDYRDNLAEYKKQGYNVVIHSHPFKSNSFSRDDIETINTHFTASLLYSCGEFTRAVIAVPINRDTILQIDAAIEIYTPVEDIDTSNIEIKYQPLFKQYKPFKLSKDMKKIEEKEEFIDFQ